jgi:hypothetical protein
MTAETKPRSYMFIMGIERNCSADLYMLNEVSVSSSPILIHLHPVFMQAFIILGLAVSGKLQSSKHMHMHMPGIPFLLLTRHWKMLFASCIMFMKKHSPSHLSSSTCKQFQ